MDSNELRTKVGIIGYHLRNKKEFRDWTRNRCEQLKAKSDNAREIYFYNIIIKYINDLDWKDIMRENQKI